MIEIKNLTVEIHNKKILDNINIVFPERGLYVISGPSGCGKSTFIKALNGLMEYKGTITFNSVNINEMSEDNKSIFRLNNIGNIFQHYGLYDNLTVSENILMVNDAIKRDNKKNINSVLKRLGIKNLKDQLVKNLSGGEKQRTAIARSIINDPKFVFADEPTGALDEYNSEQVMEILKEISANSLVIMVTHELDLAEKYAEQIINMEDGIITKVVRKNTSRQTLSKPKKYISRLTKPLLSFKFLYKYTISKFKQHKIRTAVNVAVMSLSFLGIGLSFSISNMISSSVKNTYASLIEEDRVIISSKHEKNNYMKEAVELDEVNDILAIYPDYFSDYGIIYCSNYENIFVDKNRASYVLNDVSSFIPGLTFREIAEYRWQEDCPYRILPEITHLNDDEIILGISLNQIRQMCSSFNIKQSIESLAEFLKNHQVQIIYEFANYEWEYDDEQTFTLKGVCLQNDVTIYHSGHHWNQTVIEENMRFPVKANFSDLSVEPWRLNKAYYLKAYDLAMALDLSMRDINFDPYILETCTTKYRKNANGDIKEILMFYQQDHILIPRYETYINNVIKNVSNPILCSDGGYAAYPSILMSGFAHQMLFASDTDLLYEASDLYLDNISDSGYSLSSPGVIEGYFTKSHHNSVTYMPIDTDIKYDEIIISSKLAEYLFEEDFLNKKIHIAYLANGDEEFVFTSLTIKGVIEKDKYVIYHHTNWPIIFFQTSLEISMFDLQLSAISYQIDSGFNYEQAHNDLAKAFPKLDLTLPMQDIENSLKEISFYITLVLLVGTILASVMSILIISISAKMYEKEISNDIEKALILGFSNKQIKKFAYVELFLLIAISVFFGFISLILASFIISTNGFANGINIWGSFSILPISILAMLLLAVFMFFILTIKQYHKKFKCNF